VLPRACARRRAEVRPRPAVALFALRRRPQRAWTAPAPGDVHASRTSSRVRTVLAAGHWPTTERLKRGAGAASAPLSGRSTTCRATMWGFRATSPNASTGDTHASVPSNASAHSSRVLVRNAFCEGLLEGRPPPPVILRRERLVGPCADLAPKVPPLRSQTPSMTIRNRPRMRVHGPGRTTDLLSQHFGTVRRSPDARRASRSAAAVR
jgi:hypothetical protein